MIVLFPRRPPLFPARWLLSVLHNCVVHPALPFLPARIGDRLHDVTGRWAFPSLDPPDGCPLCGTAPGERCDRETHQG